VRSGKEGTATSGILNEAEWVSASMLLCFVVWYFDEDEQAPKSAAVSSNREIFFMIYIYFVDK
jgi:hypothetical protein